MREAAVSVVGRDECSVSNQLLAMVTATHPGLSLQVCAGARGDATHGPVQRACVWDARARSRDSEERRVGRSEVCHHT